MTFGQWLKTPQGQRIADWSTLHTAPQSRQAFERRLKAAFEAGRYLTGDKPETEIEADGDEPE